MKRLVRCPDLKINGYILQMNEVTTRVPVQNATPSKMPHLIFISDEKKIIIIQQPPIILLYK